MNAAGIGDVGRPESVDGGRQGRTRDLKPANVFLVRSGAASAPPVAKLLDFGLAKSAAPVVATIGLSMLPTTPPNPTAQGTILGTFQYMAPEQIEGPEADARADIFAFGALLFEMLIGRTAFESKTRASLLGAILKDEPPRVSALQPVAPPTETTRRPTTPLWTILSRVQPRAAPRRARRCRPGRALHRVVAPVSAAPPRARVSGPYGNSARLGDRPDLSARRTRVHLRFARRRRCCVC